MENLRPGMIPASFLLSASDDIEDDFIETNFSVQIGQPQGYLGSGSMVDLNTEKAVFYVHKCVTVGATIADL